MKIDAGRYYRTRDGETVGPMRYDASDDVLPWIAVGDDIRAWHADGRRYEGVRTPGDDLIDLVDALDEVA